MTEAQRIQMAREWKAAATERMEFSQRQIDDYYKGKIGSKPDAWINATHNTLDSMLDRIHMINALFPELREEENQSRPIESETPTD